MTEIKSTTMCSGESIRRFFPAKFDGAAPDHEWDSRMLWGGLVVDALMLVWAVGMTMVVTPINWDSCMLMLSVCFITNNRKHITCLEVSSAGGSRAQKRRPSRKLEPAQGFYATTFLPLLMF